jgi:DNA-binding transcriptional LysR family regulator
LDRLASLSAFVQAAESRSFTAAGRKLGISSSAVGKTIMRLEEHLGVRLFHRSTRSITLTAEGETFLSRCQRIFAELEAAELELTQSTQTPRGRLKVSLPLVGTLLTPALSDFSKTYPDVELELDFSDRLVDVIEEGFDIVLRTGPVVDSQLMTKRLGSFSFVIVGSTSYFAARGTPQEPEDLRSHALLRHRWSTNGKLEDWHLVRDGSDVDVELPASVVTNSVEPLITMVERGAGLAYLPIFAVRRQLAEGTVTAVLDRYLKDVSTFQMLWPSSRGQISRLRAFIDFMAQHMFANLLDD